MTLVRSPVDVQQGHHKVAAVMYNVAIYGNVLEGRAPRTLPRNPMLGRGHAGILADVPGCNARIVAAEIELPNGLNRSSLVLRVVVPDHIHQRRCIVEIEHHLASACALYGFLPPNLWPKRGRLSPATD